jgi:beta-lactamase regulating signal transducer with metallopeptidase domain
MIEFVHFLEEHPFLGTLLGNIIIAVGIVMVVLISGVLLKRLQNILDYITALTVGLLLGIVFL